jgi:ABC-type uncharacterized transport system auxiliary subunit
MNSNTRLVSAFVLWGITLSSCSLTKPQPAVHHYTLTVTIPEAAAGTAKNSLIVRPFAAADPYNQERLIYRSSAYQVDFYNYHRWAASPSEQVTDWTRRYLAESGLFARVFPSTDGNADVELSGKIRQLEEVDHEQTWDATLSIDFWLTRPGQHSPFWFQSYTATRRAAKRNPEAVAEALSHNLEDILGRLTSDLAPVVVALPRP